MNKQNYQQTITVSASAKEAYQSLTTGFDNWWTTTRGNSYIEVGDRIKFTFPPNASYWTLEAKQLLPGKEVVLECVEAYHLIDGKPDAPQTEWLGTTTRWEIEPDGDKTAICFTHDGLIPDLHCYEVCKAGWDMFFCGKS